MKKKVLITGKIPPIAYQMLQEKFQVTMHEELTPLSKDEIIRQVYDIDALLPILSDTIDEAVIKAAPKLKVIANYGAGFNNIDVQLATSLGIPVTNTPVVSTNATAELTLGLMLSVSRRIVEGDKITRAGEFTGWAPLYHLGFELTGKRLGIIGMGNIGKAVAKRALAFGMEIVYFDKFPLTKEQETELNCSLLPIDELIPTSDFITLHVNYDPSLHHLFGTREFDSMKKSAFFINAARGPLMDEAALLEALQNRTIAGAGLDVYEFEPKVTTGLEKLDNVVLTPHIGNATVEAREEMAKIAARNIIEVLEGREPISCVNPNYKAIALINYLD